MFDFYPNANNFVTKNKFLTDQAANYYSSSKIGVLLNKKMLSPSDCGSFGESKTEAVKKGFSESIDRRSMLAINLEKKKVDAIDLFQGKSVQIDTNNFYFSPAGQVDTSGSAVHTSGASAAKDALLELIEKNATLLFWYGKRGYQIKDKYFDELISSIVRGSYKFNVYVADFFSPIYVVYVVLYENQKPIIVGTGSGCSILNAAKKAANEALFLNFTEKNNSIFLSLSGQKNDVYTERKVLSLASERTSEYLNSYVQKLLTFDELYELNFDTIKKALARITTRVYLHVQKNCTERLISIKIFSPDLINYVPFKMNLKFDRRIFGILNKNINLKKIPELPIM